MSNHARRSLPAAYWRYDPLFAVHNAGWQRYMRAKRLFDEVRAQPARKRNWIRRTPDSRRDGDQ